MVSHACMTDRNLYAQRNISFHVINACMREPSARMLHLRAFVHYYIFICILSNQIAKTSLMPLLLKVSSTTSAKRHRWRWRRISTPPQIPPPPLSACFSLLKCPRRRRRSTPRLAFCTRIWSDELKESFLRRWGNFP